MTEQPRTSKSTISFSLVAIISIVTLFHDWHDVKVWYLDNLSSNILLKDQLLPIRATFELNQTASTIQDEFPPQVHCISWNYKTAFNRSLQPVDIWWKDNPSYFIHTTNQSHACWKEESIRSARRDYAFHMYVNQHLNDCSHVHYRYLWSSGWGADLKNVLAAMEEGHVKHHAPAIMGWNHNLDVPKAWHYAANKEDKIKFPNGTVDYSKLNPTCPEKDLSCYFLPYHNCGPLVNISDKSHSFMGKIEGHILEYPLMKQELRRYYEWLSRPLVWFRRAVFDYQQQQGLVTRLQQNLGHATTQCSVLHVRRADIILHNAYSRKYYAIQDYLDKLPPYANREHIILFTDDANAIQEAHDFFPNTTWYHYDRKRFRGSSGGWEHQIPSLDPAFEMVCMFAAFDLMERYCKHFVHGQSAFSEYLWFHMKQKKGKGISTSCRR